MHIKKIVMKGFKSFVKKTEIPFDHGINVILGPNGSGKSNVSDALCFVLGRLSIKSMRAAKAKNLIFLGSKVASPAKEAVVEIVFDNSDKTFSIENSEVTIARIVRRNGQSIYRIDNETKTRQDVLSLLAQAGIDPNGFNIILQGEIQNFVRMHTEDRRKIIEEVSGISIYEIRKEKSLKELNRTEEKLKEVSAILRERTAYLNNLEKERQQALKFKKLEQDIKRYKASIIYGDLTKKKKESLELESQIEKRTKEIGKIKKEKTELQQAILDYESKVSSINSTIQKSSGLEQESLNQQIANIRAELAGLNVRLENYESKLSKIQREKSTLKEKIRDSELSVTDLKKDLPESKKEKELEQKKKELEMLEEQRKKFYSIKSELKSIKERIQDKQNSLQNHQNDSSILLRQIENTTLELFDKNSKMEKLNTLKGTLTEKRQIFDDLNRKEIDLEKQINISEHEIKKLTKLKEDISKLDVCPLCKNKITPQHIKEINSETNPRIKNLEGSIENSDKHISEIYSKKDVLKKDITSLSDEISKRESDTIKILSINEKKQQIKNVQEKIEAVKSELETLNKKRKFLEQKFEDDSNIDQKYETLSVELREVSLRSKETIDSEVLYKQHELDRDKISLKQLSREETDLNEESDSLKSNIEQNEELLEEKNQQEEELQKKFKKMISDRDAFQSKIRESEIQRSEKQNEIYNVEQETNNIKIDKARVDAELENLQIELMPYEQANIEIIKTNRETLTEKLTRVQDIISRIGSVNLRSLEVYDEIKKQYDAVHNRVEIIAKEKEGILKIIHEIDIKKKKTFLKTLNELNETFTRNFAQLSTKGQVTLELENRKEPFEGGVGITVKTGHGKYFDVTSLSGGEQTLVALSLIFAIQELKPYCFYILDEIDAALDKRNSERLAGLLKKYMQKGQYIVITHNDEVITKATNLYGVSMHDGISKLISLKI